MMRQPRNLQQDDILSKNSIFTQISPLRNIAPHAIINQQ